MSTEDTDKLAEAEEYHMKAQFVLNELQANNEVYGSNSSLSGADPADVDLGLQYINRSLEYFPENPVYLNSKALLLWEGKINKDEARKLLERAAEIAPRDIDIQNNLKGIKSSSCFIATAAYGSPVATELHKLRDWRDEILLNSLLGRCFVKVYYLVSPPIAKFVSQQPKLKLFFRFFINLLIKRI